MSFAEEFPSKLTFPGRIHLLRCAETNDIWSIRNVLTKREVNVNEPQHHGQTLLVAAVLNNNVDMSRYLLRWGAKVCVPGNESECSCQESGCPHAKPLYALQAALNVGSADLVLMMLGCGSKPFGHCDATLKDLFSFAVKTNHKELLEWLLCYVSNNHEEEKCMHVHHALLELVIHRNTNLAALFLDRGACPSRLYNGTLPLITAAENEDMQMCNLLIYKGVNMDGRKEHTAFSIRPNPLVVAIDMDYQKAVSYLISRGCDVNKEAVWNSYDSMSKRCVALHSCMVHFAVFKRNLNKAASSSWMLLESARL